MTRALGECTLAGHAGRLRAGDCLALYDRPVRPTAATEIVSVPPCLVCDATRASPRFDVDGIDSPIVVCAGCGLGRFAPMLSPAEIASFYPDEYYGAPGSKFVSVIEWGVRIVASRHTGFLSAGLAPGARVLDVGCGRGVILGPLADRGFEAHGVELSEAAVHGADPRAQMRIASDLTAAGYDAESFDQIVIWHVLEHLLDPRATLEECHRILKPGGRLVVAVPNFSSWQARIAGAAWFHLDAPRHLYQFPLAALRRLIDRCGFECGRTHHFSLRQNPFGWIQSLQNRVDPERPNRLYTALHGSTRQSGAGGASRLATALWLALGSLPGLVLALAAAACRSGATVHVVAQRSDARG